MRIADDPLDACEARQLFRRALSVASGDKDACGLIPGMDVANGIARLSVGRGSDGAGVEHDDFGIAMHGNTDQSAIEHLPLDRGRIRVGNAATKIFDGESGHRLFRSKHEHTSRADYSSGRRDRECGGPETKSRLNREGPAGEWKDAGDSTKTAEGSPSSSA